MITTIHQPQFFPWLGYFDKIRQADQFILLDNVQFKKNEWQNRNRIKNAQGAQWLTVPVRHRFGQTINEVVINNTVPWRRQHMTAIELNYRKAPYFDQYIEFFKEIYSHPWEYLAELNIYVIRRLMMVLGISTKIIRASYYDTDQVNTARLVDLCVKTESGTYISGPDGAHYMDLELFKAQDVVVLFQNYIHPVYNQFPSTKNNQDFISHLSIIDLLFNYGRDSFSILTSGQTSLQPS